MERRHALKLTAGLMGATLIGADLFLSGCSNNSIKTGLISETDVLFLDEVGEVILPETDISPGAKTAKIGVFMRDIVNDCYTEEEQDIFIKGIISIENFSNETYSTNFMKLTKNQKQELLIKLDNEIQAKEEIPHYFRMMKELTIWGYFTSMPGATTALRYNPIPGSFQGCIPYSKHDKAWA